MQQRNTEELEPFTEPKPRSTDRHQRSQTQQQTFACSPLHIPPLSSLRRHCSDRALRITGSRRAGAATMMNSVSPTPPTLPTGVSIACPSPPLLSLDLVGQTRVSVPDASRSFVSGAACAVWHGARSRNHRRPCRGEGWSRNSARRCFACNPL